MNLGSGLGHMCKEMMKAAMIFPACTELSTADGDRYHWGCSNPAHAKRCMHTFGKPAEEQWYPCILVCFDLYEKYC